jgi:uncharacterized protein
MVVTVPSLDGMTIEEYANRLFAAWRIGKKAHNNGVLFLVAPADRKVRIEVGYGLEPVLPDGLAGEIIRANVLPRFKEGDYTRGIRDGLTRVATIVRANHTLTADERRTIADSDRPPGLVVFLFLACFIVPARRAEDSAAVLPAAAARAAAGDCHPVSRVHSRSHDLSGHADGSRRSVQ